MYNSTPVDLVAVPCTMYILYMYYVHMYDVHTCIVLSEYIVLVPCTDVPCTRYIVDCRRTGYYIVLLVVLCTMYLAVRELSTLKFCARAGLWAFRHRTRARAERMRPLKVPPVPAWSSLRCTELHLPAQESVTLRTASPRLVPPRALLRCYYRFALQKKRKTAPSTHIVVTGAVRCSQYGDKGQCPGTGSTGYTLQLESFPNGPSRWRRCPEVLLLCRQARVNHYATH